MISTKIITYASGLDAGVVVWIVARAGDEHAGAIEWLNKHTDDDLSFFLIEVHAYKILLLTCKTQGSMIQLICVFFVSSPLCDGCRSVLLAQDRAVFLFFTVFFLIGIG